MRSTTLFVWVAIALVLGAGMSPVSDALAQFQFDGTQITCIHGTDGDGIINSIGDSLELTIVIGGRDTYADAVEVVFNPISGFGVIPTLPQTFSCPTGLFVGHRMQATVVHDSGIVTAHPDSAKIRARYRFRPEGICGNNIPVSYQLWARGVRSAINDTLCGNSETFNRTIPCSTCTGCGYIRIDERCGFVDGIIAIGDRVFLDTAATEALEAALPPPTGGARDTIYVNFNTLTCNPITGFSDTVFVVGDIVDVVECARENGVCGDTFQIRVGYWTGSWPPSGFDSTKRISVCTRPVDNVAPQLEAGMVDSFRIINGNDIANDSLVGCCDTLRIYMATDSALIGAAYPFFGDVDGTPYGVQPCGSIRRHNFDISWIGLWFGDLMGEARENDTSGYLYNSTQKGLLCPADTFLWMSNRFGTGADPGATNNLMWIDIPFCPQDWDSLQICLLDRGEGLVIGEDTLFIWAIDDAGNRSNYIPWADTALCIDVVPPPAQLGSDIYHSDGYCTKRFSPYDSTTYVHYRYNLPPDSMEWLKARVDTFYDATDLLSVFNDVYMIGFDVRVMPNDTAPITKLNYLHPMAPVPMDPTLDTLRWRWETPYDDPNDTLQNAIFTWWGKRGTEPNDPVLGTGDAFWKCTSGGGLTVGFTFARWMDAAGCNKILGWDYDGSTSIDDNYTTRNRLRGVVDLCFPGFVDPGDTMICSNLPFNSGGFYDLPGPDPVVPTYLWVGPNAGGSDDPVLRFRPKRNFAQNPFDECLTEDTLYYRVRLDTVDLISAITTWPGPNDSVRWYSGESYWRRSWGSGNPGTIWSPIVFNAGDLNGPEVSFTWRHKFAPPANGYLPDGLYKLSLELRDDAGNVTVDPIYIWLNGAGPQIDSLVVCNMDTQCTFNFYTGQVQDTLAIWLQTDTTADQVLIDWSCVYNISAHPDRDTTFAQLVSSSNTFKKWFGYLIITPDMVSDVDSLNVYEVAPWEADCEKDAGGLRIINVRALDISGGDTLISEADPQHDCDKAAIGLTPCPRLISLGGMPGYEYFYFADPDSPQTLIFGPGATERHAISPGKIDSMGGAGTYHAIFNWANDQVQDSVFVRLLIDSVSVRTDTLDTLIVQFINPNYNPPRIREIRKGLFRPTSTTMTPDPNIQNTIYHGMLERDDGNEAFIEFRYFWNGTWFIGAGEDSLMLVPYDQQDTIMIKAFVQAVDTVIGDSVVFNECPDTLYALLDVDNINPDFRSGWTEWNAPGHHPVTGSTRTVQNLGWDADGDGTPEDCGFRFSDGENFRLRVKMTEEVHFDPAAYPNQDGSHHDAGGYWPLTQAWQISPIDLRTLDLFAFGPNPGDSCVVVLDSVLVNKVSNDSVYYTLCGHFDFPPAAVAYFAANPGPVDSVLLLIRSAWDEAGNPGRYNNPVFFDGLGNDSAEDTTFWVVLTSPDPWTGCPLVYGKSDSVLGWITAEEDSVIVKATIIETSEISTCAPGVYADSIHILEGNFQTITDDPNPWVIWDERTPWFLYIVGTDTLGWARTYTWYLRADSSDLATIHCDGDFLPFTLRFNTHAIPSPMFVRSFNNCVQVDVNEPRWAEVDYLDSLGNPLVGCFDPRQPVTIVALLSDAFGDPASCGYSPGVGVLENMVWADLTNITGNAALDSVAPDTIVAAIGTWAMWTITPDPALACVDSAWAWIRLHALWDSLNHHDRELFFQDTLWFCSDCLPPELRVAEAYCDCDSAEYFYTHGLVAQRPLQHVNYGAPISLYIFVRDQDGDSSSGMSANVANYQADLSSIDETLGWTNAQLAHIWPGIPEFGAAIWYAEGCNSGTLTMNHYYENGDTIFVDFRICDAFGNCDTVWHYPVAIVDSLAPIVDFVYTIGDDSIRAYVTPGDDHVHIYADLTGYAADLVTAPKDVWMDMSRFWCDTDSAAKYDTVYADAVVQTGPNSYRAYWGWYPGPWVTDPSLYPIPYDSLSLPTDRFAVDPAWASCHSPSIEGWHDTLWFYVTDHACNTGSAFSVFEVSGIDSTVPAVDSVWIVGNGCKVGWISSTPLDSGHIEVWAFMDSAFNDLGDTLLIDSMQANLAQLSPDYAWTQWSFDLKGGAPAYGVAPDMAQPVQAYWEMVGNKLVAKWVFLTARDLGCLDSVVVGVKAIRTTGHVPAAHAYYIDVEYGRARVDTTRPVIYDMRVHSATTSINETTWVSPNVPLYVDVWAYDTNCDTVTDHLGFDLTHGSGGPGPFIAFCDPTGGFDTLWSWNVNTPDSVWIAAAPDANGRLLAFFRWIGTPNFDDTCNSIDFDNITGCIEAHLEDCLSNPAVPVQRRPITDDRPPQYVRSVPWGDYTIETGFPGDPDFTGIDSVLVLQRGIYGLDYDSLLTVFVIVDNWPGDTLLSWAGTYINFDPWGPYTFLTTPIQYPDEIYYNIDGNHRDSIVWKIPLYDGGGPLFNTSIPSDRYWFQLVLRDTTGNVTGDPLDEIGYHPFTLFCDDLDSVISFTIQNWNTPNPGMILLCDSTTVAGSDTDFVDFHNMNLWNNEFFSPDTEMKNLYKIYYAPGQWGWYSHEDVNRTRFFIFVEDTVLQSDNIDNDADGLVDEVGEGVDFYTADLRINGWEGPQVGHVDSMNVGGVWINYLWFADNFDEQRYDIYLRISDIYGHIDTLACGDYALQFYEDETCPVGHALSFWDGGQVQQIRFNDHFLSSYDLTGLSADDSMFVFANFDSISIVVKDPAFALFGNPHGSGPDLDTTTVDSINYNNGQASVIELLDPLGNPVLGFVQRYMDDTDVFDEGPLMLVDPTGVALDALPDGIYTIRVTLLDRVGNSCVRTWSFKLDRTCPNIQTAFTTRPGQNTPVSDLYSSWDYVEIIAHVADSLDGVDSVHFEYCFDANRDGVLDAYPFWQTANILSDEGGAWDTHYPFTVYWNVRNLPWSSEDTLGLPPVRPDSCVNRYFVRVRAEDHYGHECSYVFPVDVTDDIAPLAYIRHVDFDFTPQGHVVQCYNPNLNLGDSTIWVSAYDYITDGFDPEPGDTFTWSHHWFDLAKGVFQYKLFDAPNVQTGDPYTGWTTMKTPGQDTATYRNWFTEAFHIQWNLIHPTLREPLRSGQYNIRFVGIDVCGNSDPLNTPVITVRLECDTTAPIAVICQPEADSRLTNWRCDPEASHDGWVLVQSVSGIWADVDSVAFFFVDSLSVPGLGIHTFIGGDGTIDNSTPGAAYAETYWNTNNLLSGWYWLYAVAYDNDGNFDTDPIWQRVYVDNTMPTVDSCMIWTHNERLSINDGDWFYLIAYPSDPDGGSISQVLFQYLDRRGNWVNLPNGVWQNNQSGLYGADVYADQNPVTAPEYPGEYWQYVCIRDFDQSPLDSIRFRAIAVDHVDIGSNNWQGDYNRDCNVDRDLDCGTEVCCMALEIRDRIPDQTCMWAYNHGSFTTCCLPVLDTRYAIGDGEQFSTCNYQNPLDTLLLVAKVHSSVTDGWLMHFKFWRSFPYDHETTPQYVPNDVAVNPWIPPIGPIVLYHSWDSVYVIWTGARAYLDSADAADGLWYSEWTFAAQVEDLTGNVEGFDDCNTTEIILTCLPNAPVTDVSYVANDVNNPENRVRVTEEVPYNDFVPDTIEVLYNRTTGPGTFDPEALVIFYTDLSSIVNCRGHQFTPFNIQLYEVSNPGNDTYGRICPTYPYEPFGYAANGLGFDQSPPDDANNNRYAVGLYLNNSYGPGVYNFAMIVRLDSVAFPNEYKVFYEGDADLDDDFDHHDSTRIDLVVRVVNVNEPQLSICYPEYGATCVSGTTPMSASVLDNPEFTGEIDTVWFQYFDGSTWLPIIDPVTGVSYDTHPNSARVRFEFNEYQVPDMAGWYYTTSGRNVQDPELSWYAERDLFPDVWVWIEGMNPVPMSRDENGRWIADVDLDGTGCRYYGFIVDANDNNLVDPDGTDRWLRDPRDPCSDLMYVHEQVSNPASQVCLCTYAINFPSREFANTSYNFRTVVGWHDDVAYHVIENPSLGDTIHVFFVDNEPAEATHDIEFDATVLSGGMFDGSPGGYPEVCNPADTVWFVTDIQPLGTHHLVVEDICKVVYQVSMTSQPQTDHGWRDVYTVYSNRGMGWTEAWPGYWVAKNPLKDNIDNDGDGLVDETHNVQAGDRVGEENVTFYTRSVVYDNCGNVYYSNLRSIVVDVSEPQACITQVGDVSPADNQVIIIPPDRDLVIVATDQSYADPGILAVFQYRRLGVPFGDPSGAWRNIEADAASNDTIRHIGNTYTAVWDLYEHQWRDTAAGYWHDPEGWFQLRAIAIDTVGNGDDCDRVICQITVRLNDIQPAARVEVYKIRDNMGSDAVSCTDPDILYIRPYAPYFIKAIFAATDIDTGLASLTFQYQSLTPGGDPSEWRNIQTIYDQLNYGLNGDTTVWVPFQPRPQDIGQHGFNIRVIVEDYNGNDTSAVVTLYADNTPPEGSGEAGPSVAVTGPCGDRCRLDITPGSAVVSATFLPDPISGEVNVNQAWLQVRRDDGAFFFDFAYMTRLDEDTWIFDFNGDLCQAWHDANLDMGCYHFWVHFNDCIGNTDSLAVFTTCGEGEPTSLICVDCDPDLPELATLDRLTYESWDCTTEPGTPTTITDVILDGTTEIGGDQMARICGHIPSYQQYVRKVLLFVESEEANVESTLVDDFDWLDSRRSSVDTAYCFYWNLGEVDGDGNYVYPSGYYRVWVLALDAICQLQSAQPLDEFWVHVDHGEPDAWITRIANVVPNPSAPDTFEVNSFFGSGAEGGFWVEWADHLTPDDSTQAHNIVQLWAKNQLHPNQADAWHMVGRTPSPCNPHFVVWEGEFVCGETFDLVAIAQDRWGNGDLDVDRVMEAYAAGRWVDIYLHDVTPPVTQLWSIGLNANITDEEDQVVADQQNHLVHISSNFWDQDVYLNVLASGADPTIERVHFQYSLDGETWFDIATDEEPSAPGSCEGMTLPLPWWCDYSSQTIQWSALWDISGLRGHVWVRHWAQDACGNTEGYNVYEVTIDVQAPMAKVFAWMSDVNVDNLPCTQWTEPQIPDTLERYTTLTLGACPDSTGTVHYDADKARWYIKRADADPLNNDSWCYLGRDDDAPFSKWPVQLWDRDSDCLEPQVGAYYDIAVRMSDNNDHTVPWVQFLYYGQGGTPAEQWQDLINRGYVKRFKVVDHIAPVAHTLEVDTDCTPDSSVIFLHGRVDFTAISSDPDVWRMTFAAREQGAEGPWTIIDIVQADSNGTVQAGGCSWNTELMNGTYILGVFAEDYYGNRDGNPNAANAWPTHTLTVNVDNQAPTATITQVLYNGAPVTSLERGAVHTFDVAASDNFGLSQVALYFRHRGGDPDNWHLIGIDTNWPYSFNWLVPETLVVGWSYDFAAVAADLCYSMDMMDGQGHYVVDGTFPIVDLETYLAIYSIGGQDAITTPHVHGTDVCLVAHSEPRLDNVRFLFVRDGDTTLVGTVVNTIGTTVWALCGWDVTTIAEGPAQLCVVGSADFGGDLVTLAVDCRNIVIDHSLPYGVSESWPASHGLLGGSNCDLRSELESWADDLFIRFNVQQTDAFVDTVWFEWKMAADPDHENYWHTLCSFAVLDQGLTRRWAYSWEPSLNCGLITLRARVSDNAVPQSNEALIIFADSVRVDNEPPVVVITNINGDVTPAGTEIGWGQVANIVATITDPFCQGGNSSIDSAAFFMADYTSGAQTEWQLNGPQWIFIGGDGDGTGALWQALWNTSTVDPGHYLIRVVGWDEAGNCSEYITDVFVVDQLYQRAWIVGFDADNNPGCDDRLWAITDDCPPNYTASVIFEYSTNGGTTWISLGEDQAGDQFCDTELDYNMWSVEFEFDNIPAGAIFRAVARDESNNFDPSPPRFQFSDVTASSEAVIYHQDFVRLHAAGGQVPWVSAMLEQAPPNDNCYTARGLVCVNPVAGDPTGYAGILPEATRPCNLENRDGRITVYSAVPVTRGDNTYMVITTYKMDIHQVDFETGSNGWLSSEDTQLQMYVPVDGVQGYGTAWFQPAADDDIVNMIGPHQYYYTMIGEVEYVLTKGIESGQHESRFRMKFDPQLLPEGVEPWNVVAAYYDRQSDMWTELGVIYEDRDLVNGRIDFHFAYRMNWNASNDVSVQEDDTVTVVCPNKIAFTVMYTTVRPIDEWVRFSNEYCDLEPDSTYYTPERGPSVGCDVTWWAVLRQGEYIPPENTIDVYLDGIRIVNDGQPDRVNGCDEYGTPLFWTSYNEISGVYSVRFAYAADFEPPWYASGCLRNGQHTIQFYTNNLHTHLTPFWVDRTEPEAWTYPEYINHQINLWANLTDAESGIDTNSAYVVISDCTPSAFTFRTVFEVDTISVRIYSDSGGYIGDSLIVVVDSFAVALEVIINDPTRAFVIESEAMTFTPIESGYRAEFSMQWEALQQWLIQNNNAGTMCVTWAFRNNVCHWNDSTTYVYTIDVEPPMVWPVSPVGAAIDNDGDGVANEDWRDCINNDNDWWWNAEFAHWQERVDEDPVDFLPDTIMYGERPVIQAVMNDLAMCGSGASGVNVPGIWLMIDGQRFTPADTTNPALNFFIQWPYGQQDDAFLSFGGTANAALDWVYAPGEHRITCAAPDSAGNVGSLQFSWTYYVRASGPAIVFDTTTRPCGVWFNPEESNYFEFDVNGTAGMPIAVNGIQYSVYTVPGGQRISGPTTINPTDPQHARVRYNLSGSFPDGQTGIEIVVDAWNILYNPQVDTLNGITHSRMTFWADNLAPTFTSHLPNEGEIFNRDEAIVIEVFYSDDSPAGVSSTGKGTETSSKRADVRVSRLDDAGNLTPLAKGTVTLPADSRGRGTLDDNGSGIDVSSFGMSIVKPDGDVITPTAEQFIVLDRAHAKYVMPPVHLAGRYTVNVHISDCVGNVAADSWTFHVASSAPGITFLPLDLPCTHDGYWAPDRPLYLRARVQELDGVNITHDNIRVDIVRVYNCASGLCADTLVPHANVTITPPANPTVTDQVFELTANYNLDVALATVELRLVVTATNALGATGVRVQPWIVDGTAPWITIVSPVNNAVLPETMPVTISANFGDTEDGSVAMLPGGRDGRTVETIKVGPQRTTQATGSKFNTGASKLALGAWAEVVTSSLDDLDGNSGVDLSCIELLLFPHDGSGVRNLTEASVIRPNNITWIGPLAPGSYTAILSVCDHVCNTSSVNWDFVVAPDEAGVTYDPPYYVSSMPHTFIMHTYGSNIDHASMNLTIEGAVMVAADTGSYMLWVPIVDRAAVQWAADSVWYTANFDLATYVQLRLTLRMNFNYGVPVPTGSQVYVVDTGAPAIVSVTPDPAIVLPIGASPTFYVEFVEVGNTSLNPASIRLRLETANSVQISGRFAYSVDNAGRSGYASLAVDTLARGDYRLFAEVADMAGNRTFANFLYQVRDTSTVPPPARLMDKETAYNYPNPFDAGEATHFWLPLIPGAGAYVEIKIYDFAGAYVATVYDGYLMPGVELEWRGLNDDLEQVASGVYLARVVTTAEGKSKEDIVKVAFRNKR